MADSIDNIVGPWGYYGVEFWSFRPSQKINQIVISYDDAGDNIIALTFSSTKANGSKDTIKVGGDGPNTANSTQVNIDNADEYLTNISGTTGSYLGNNVLRSITFTSNKREYGPYGIIGEVPFSSHIPNGYKIVGFLGRSGHYINAIGTYYAPNNN